MSTDPKIYPTRFYGRTWLAWAGVLILGPFAFLFCFMGSLLILGIEQKPDGCDGFALMCMGLVFLLMVFFSIFQVFARQSPILKIYREGIMFRSIGTPFASHNLILGILSSVGGILLAFPLIIFWQCITLQAFRIRTVRWRWENVYIEAEPGGYFWTKPSGGFSISGLIDKDADEYLGQDAPLESFAVSYQGDSFGMSIKKVNEAIFFFLYNPDSRESLPSWQNEETVFGNDAFDFQ